MPQSEKLYVLGHPVAHSKSPAMYNAVYAKLGLNWNYGLMDCVTAEEAEAFLSARDFLSVNVTMPYKPHALAAATVRAASAQLAGGANVLVKAGESLVAYNTDGLGCVAYLERCGFDFAGARVVVCGTGPTSLAIMHAAAQAGAAEVVLLGRDEARARAALDAYLKLFGKLAYATFDLPAAKEGHRSFRETYEQTLFFAGSYEGEGKRIAGASLIVDATPLGMKPEDPAPFDTALLHAGQTIFDVVYGHGETALAAGARAAGAGFIDGAGMLVGQAVETVRVVCDLSGVECPLSDDELFELMAKAANFTC